MTENWRPIPGYEGLYEVSDLGSVRGLPRSCGMRGGLSRVVPGKVLALSTVTGGYAAVCLTRDGKSRTKTVHPIVLDAFVGPRPDGMQACHENGVRTDNRLANLRWGTATENWGDRRRHGRDVTGERHPNALLTDAEVLAARARFAAGESLPELAAAFGLSRSGMSNVLLGASYSHLPLEAPALRRHGNARLQVAEVESIRARAAAGERRSDLAREHGVSGATIGRLINGRAWNA